MTIVATVLTVTGQVLSLIVHCLNQLGIDGSICTSPKLLWSESFPNWDMHESTLGTTTTMYLVYSSTG
jgi:hypothetical protein